MSLTLEKSGQLELSLEERTQLSQCEAVIERGLRTFVEVGQALLTIHDQQLYRETHDSFEAYCRDKWDISSNYGKRLIRAAEIVNNLAIVPIGTDGREIRPQNEAQVRELAAAPEDKREEAWRTTVEKAGNGTITARQVHEVVQTYKSPEEAKPETPSEPLQTFFTNAGTTVTPTEAASSPEASVTAPETAPIPVIDNRAATSPPAQPVSPSATKPAAPAPATPPTSDFVQCLIPQQEDDWLWENGLTVATAIAELREVRSQLYNANMALRRPQLTHKAELALNALIADFNGKFPEEPTSPTVMLEGLLVTRAREKGLTFEETVVHDELNESEDTEEDTENE